MTLTVAAKLSAVTKDQLDAWCLSLWGPPPRRRPERMQGDMAQQAALRQHYERRAVMRRT